MLKAKISSLTIICISLLLFLPLISNFFWSDDWYFLWISRISSFNEFFQFFSFGQNPHTTPMYRPLSTQVFFFVFQSLFGLHAWVYYLCSLVVWGIGLYILYKLVSDMFKDRAMALLTLTLYSFSASHFARLSYLSAFQEILMFTLGMTAIYCMTSIQTKRGFYMGIVAFLTALMSKESAIVLPALMILVELYKGTKVLNIKLLRKYLPIFIISCIYIYLRFIAKDWTDLGDGNYAWNFSIFRAIHTTIWYALWSFGLPELVIHYVGSKASILPRFWTDFPVMAKVLSAVFLLSIGTFFIGVGSWVWQHMKEIKHLRTITLGKLWFIIGILPIVFLPDHKYVLGQSLALVGMAIVLAEVMYYSRRYLREVAFVSYIVLNLVSIVFLYQTNISLQRSEISRRTYTYITEKYPNPPAGFYFKNDKPIQVEEWGQSRQIHQAVGEYFFSVIYGKSYKNVAYEDDPQPGVVMTEWQVLPSSLFVK